MSAGSSGSSSADGLADLGTGSPGDIFKSASSLNKSLDGGVFDDNLMNRQVS